MSGKTSTASKRKYNNANYDYTQLVTPKGEKEKIKAAATAAGQSVNNYIYQAIRRQMEQDAISSQNKTLTYSISSEDIKMLEQAIRPIIQSAPHDQLDMLKVELNKIICDYTDKIANSKNTLSYPTLL